MSLEKEDLIKSRAWIEINLNNLEQNLKELKKVIPSNTKIMAVVKANAYGHGAVFVSKKLNELGIFDFAVATLKEGIELRENGIQGNILILGYTDFHDLKYVLKYDLIQTVVDYLYARTIEEMSFEEKIRVHLKINTGMNRIGESYQNISKIKEMYTFKNLKIEGIFTHLSVSDSRMEEDIEFTKGQIKNFYSVIEKLREANLKTGSIHIQSSYGIVNYKELKCDFVRPGIFLYGVLSEPLPYKIDLDLKPVLSLKARITSIREIREGESVSYGRKYIATSSLKIASVSIGYADGYPRNLSLKGAKVLVNGQYAPLIGRICMDALSIDVTNIHSVKQGDEVTLIGEEDLISALSLAVKSETITNELLSRLGNRLERMPVK